MNFLSIIIYDDYVVYFALISSNHLFLFLFLFYSSIYSSFYFIYLFFKIIN